MVFGIGFRSNISHIIGENPIRFKRNSKNVSDADSKSFNLQQLINENVPELKDKSWYWSHAGYMNGHLQTAAASFHKFQHIDQVYYKRFMLHLPDGGIAAVDYVQHPKNIEEFMAIDNDSLKHETQIHELPPRTKYFSQEEVERLPSDDDKPLMIVLHGLSGGSYESYIRCFLEKITSDPYNFEAVVLNARGCANSSLATPQLFCGLWTDDLRNLVEHLRTIYPNRKLYALGCSLGASILANYLGQESDKSELSGAAVLACPWDLFDCYINIKSSLLGNYVYSPVMAQNLLKLLDKHLPQLDPKHLGEYESIKPKIKRIIDFDDYFTSKLFGFNCATEYYRHASPVNRLLSVRTPLLILNSLDDPVSGRTSLPYREVKKNPYTIMITTSLGGHLGWFDSSFRRFYSDPLSKFFSVLNENYLSESDLIVTKGSLPVRNKMVDGKLVL